MKSDESSVQFPGRRQTGKYRWTKRSSPGKSGYRKLAVPGLHLYGNRVYRALGDWLRVADKTRMILRADEGNANLSRVSSHIELLLVLMRDPKSVQALDDPTHRLEVYATREGEIRIARYS